MRIEHFCVSPTIVLPQKGGNERILSDLGVKFYSLIGHICQFLGLKCLGFCSSIPSSIFRFQISKTGFRGRKSEYKLVNSIVNALKTLL
mgnify:CR=1 FL=1